MATLSLHYIMALSDTPMAPTYVTGSSEDKVLNLDGMTQIWVKNVDLVSDRQIRFASNNSSFGPEADWYFDCAANLGSVDADATVFALPLLNPLRFNDSDGNLTISYEGNTHFRVAAVVSIPAILKDTT